MEFSWTEEQRQGYRQAREFAEQELAAPAGASGGAGRSGQPGADAAPDPAAEFHRRWRRCADFGVLALNVASSYGGLGLSTRSAVRVLEGLGRGCRDNGLLMALGAQLWSVSEPLAVFGREEQKRNWLPRMVNGEAIGAFALSEPESGSDAFRLRTRAVAEAGGYRIEGVKTFVTNAPLADLFLVFAATDPAAGYFGVTAFLVSRELRGVGAGAPMHKMGLETSPMGELRLDRVWVPAEAVLGEVGGGGAVLQATLEWERGCLLAPALGTMDRLLEASLAHCRSRKQFGRPIIEFEAVGQLLAELRLRLEVSRLLAYEFAWLKDEGRGAALEASMVKLYVSESYRRAAEVALHLHGALGYLREYEFESCWRDAMASSLYSGTTEMQQNLIAESLLRRPSGSAVTLPGTGAEIAARAPEAARGTGTGRGADTRRREGEARS